MATDSENTRKRQLDLMRSLYKTLEELRKTGSNITIWGPMSNKHSLTVMIEPSNYCYTHQRWSVGDHCLWCEPEEFKGAGVA